MDRNCTDVPSHATSGVVAFGAEPFLLAQGWHVEAERLVHRAAGGGWQAGDPTPEPLAEVRQASQPALAAAR